jgi:RNase P/RNase MRP subunit p29
MNPEAIADLIDYSIQVLKSTNKSHVGLTGVVSYETQKTLHIRKKCGTVKVLEKKILLVYISDLDLIIDCARLKNIYTRKSLFVDR